MIYVASRFLAAIILIGAAAAAMPAAAATDGLPPCSEAPAKADCHMHDRRSHIMQGNKTPQQPHAGQEHRDWLREEQNGGRRS
ncbi:MAG: hypothetical protein J0H82_26750 [Alphaproteobacteria bacterium]|uniref:hypothetical protein n=1 Tax=Rhizorhabdus sp. TaxID=1968843 RepID=UPI001AC38192|nr:hypothetical protein [Rhizorhabdus sp.]MBN9529836.1 hypothetical protein [Alphaproteobacteria bacterium]MBP8233314.1 hypothetical protein [Rhizorhabdus sp.]